MQALWACVTAQSDLEDSCAEGLCPLQGFQGSKSAEGGSVYPCRASKGASFLRLLRCWGRPF